MSISIIRTERDKKIVEQCERGRNFTEVAVDFGMTGQNVSRIYGKHCRAIRNMIHCANQPWQDLDLRYVGLSTRAYNALLNLGYSKLSELINSARLPEFWTELQDCNNIGHTTFSEIAIFLEKQGS